MPQFALHRQELDQFVHGDLQADLSLHRALEIANNHPCDEYVRQSIRDPQCLTRAMVQDLLDHAATCSDALFKNIWQESNASSETLNASAGLALADANGRLLTYREMHDAVLAQGNRKLSEALPIEAWSSIVVQAWTNQTLLRCNNPGQLDPSSARVVHYIDRSIPEDNDALFDTNLLEQWIDHHRNLASELLHETSAQIRTQSSPDDLLLFLAYWRFAKQQFLRETEAIEIID